MPGTVMRYYEVLKWACEFLMLPLHYLALNHMYVTASVLGGIVLMAYATMSIKHEQLQRQMQATAH